MIRRLSIVVLAAGLSALAVGATEVKIFSLQGQDALLEGELDGVSIDPLGTLRLAERARRLVELDEPYAFSAAAHRDGFVVGTGSQGRVLLVGRDGTVRTLFSTEEPDVFALWVDRDGTVFAGSSPDGRLYRLDPGAEEAVVHAEIEGRYIWDLTRDADGRLLVATGTEGRLWEVADDGSVKLRYDAEDTHLRSLMALDDGRVLIGTAGEGLVLELSPDGSVRTLYDASGPEVVDFAVGADGTRYVAALASEASLVDLSTASKNGNDDDEEGASGVTVTVQQGAVTAGSRPSGYQGARSEILALQPDGGVETLWRFEKATVFDLLWLRDRLWVATGLDGQLFSWQGDRMVLEKDVDEKQVVALVADEPGPAFVSTNAAAVFRLERGTELSGTYTSDVLDAGQIARFGRLSWRGELAAGTTISWQARSGMSSQPDATWSDWSEPQQGREVTLADLARGRYVQWRARLEGDDGESPVITGVELSYLQLNRRPRIEKFEVLDPGQILVPANFNPANQVFEPPSPNREGIFTTIDPESGQSGATKQLWKRGFRSFRWQASDPNDDSLEYRLSFRPEEHDDWLTVADELDDDYYSFDATVLPDGRYRFRIEASDREDNLPGEQLVEERSSEVVVIDHSPPTVAAVRREGSKVVVELEDAWSPIRKAEISVDAGPWRGLSAADGLLDGRQERLEIEAVPGQRLLLLRLTDAAYNVTTHDLSTALGDRP